MRELKFRAWDGKKIRYDVTGFEHGVSNEMGGIFLDGDFYLIGDDHSAASKLVHPKAKVMQYTGLKDINGKDIYEGDVVYLAGYGNYVCEYPFLELFDAGAELDIGEIKGNIYDNPELANETT